MMHFYGMPQITLVFVEESEKFAFFLKGYVFQKNNFQA